MRATRAMSVPLALGLLAAGCGDDDEETAGSTTVAEGEAPVVVLEPGALSVFGDEGSQHLAFGDATEAETTDTLTAALGEAVREEDLAECGEGPLVSIAR